ncbi:hypothetical protein [Variovorax sp. PBL-H6]|uniref:hypothetical protein n=1 Tax=Variovorax sp. PBL-H6 TaxID=434009 RepID=UPI0018D5D5F5
MHARALVDLLDSYARDPAGGGAPLAPEVLAGCPKRWPRGRRPSACWPMLTSRPSASSTASKASRDPAFSQAMFLQKKL